MTKAHEVDKSDNRSGSIDNYDDSNKDDVVVGPTNKPKIDRRGGEKSTLYFGRNKSIHGVTLNSR